MVHYLIYSLEQLYEISILSFQRRKLRFRMLKKLLHDYYTAKHMELPGLET